jgi:site-specific recombinase XerD
MLGMVDDHLRHLARRNLRPSTITQRRLALRRLGRTFDLTRVCTDQIEQWLDTRDLQPEGRATEISHLRGFYKWAVAEGRLPADPTLRLVRPKIARRLPRPMPEADLTMAVELAPEPVRSMLMLAAFAGLRACEIARLEGEHINRYDRVILVIEGKGGGMSSVPISPALDPTIRQLPDNGPLFHLTDGRRMAPHNVSQWCNRYLHDMGITHTLHSLRHRFGTAVYQASGRDLRATQELLRHRTPVSTAIYTWVSPGHLADAVGKLPDVGGQERLPW